MVLAIRNLLDNAIKYSGTSNQSCDVSFKIQDNHLYMSIIDYGKGIEEENILLKLSLDLTLRKKFLDTL